MRALCGALHLPYVESRVTPCALVVHQHSYVPHRCRTLQYLKTFVERSL